jgi:hypothetical protein
LNATRNLSRRTVEYSSSAGLTTVDSIYSGQDQKGSILYPTTWGAGFIVEHENTWQFGAELGMAEWSAYRYYGVGDKLQNNWTARLGGQIIPDFKSDNYWKRVAYRLGASFGPDIFNLGTNLPQSSFSFGFGLPVRRNVYTNQYTIINTAFEIGSRGNKSNEIRESIFRLSLGLNLSDIWFNKPKYQ